MDTPSLIREWWQDDVEEPAGTLVATLDAIKNSQGSRLYNSVRFDSLYDGVDYTGMGSTLTAGLPGRPRMPTISFNALRVVGETLLSKLVQNDIKPTFLTDGADWAERKKGQYLDKFVGGEFYRLDAYTKATTAREHGIRHGNGYLKIAQQDDKVTIETVHPQEIWVDSGESLVGPPQQMFQERFVTRSRLYALYPDKKEIIDNASRVTDMTYYYFPFNSSDLVRVVEAWHLPSGAKAEDGKHMLVMDSGILVTEEWKRPTFPFAVFRLYPRAAGFYYIGLVERQADLQLRMNRLLRRMHECMNLLGAPYFLIEAGSKVVKAHFNTDIGNQITFIGTEPKLIINSQFPSEFPQEFSRILQWMFQDAGINQLDASGQKPEGLDSAPAIERYNDVSQLRHTPLLKANQQFFLDLAECVLDEVRDIYKRTGKYEVYGHERNFVEIVDWKNLDLKRESYVLKLAPMNTLPETPAGKINEVIRLADAGILTPAESIRGLRSPDIEAITNDVTASVEDIEWTIFEMTKPKGARYLPPEEFQDLNEGMIKVGNALLRERMAGAPPEILSNLLRWLTDADQKLAEQQTAMQSAMAATAPQEAGAQGAPGGQPPTAPPQPIGTPTQSPLSSAPMAA